MGQDKYDTLMDPLKEVPDPRQTQALSLVIPPCSHMCFSGECTANRARHNPLGHVARC
jgi:hypothetical protein